MLHDESNALIPQGDIVRFNQANLTNGITYNQTTGELTLPTTGQYLITWWINASRVCRGEDMNLPSNNEYALGIELHKITPFDTLIAHSSTHNRLKSNESGTISGNAIFNAEGNSIIRFINTSPVDIRLIPNDRYSASVSITKIN